MHHRMALHPVARNLNIAAVLEHDVPWRDFGADLVADMRAVADAEETVHILARPDGTTDHQRAGIWGVGEGPGTENGGDREAVVGVEVREQDQGESVHRRCGSAHQRGNRRAAVDENASVDEIPGVAAAAAERAAAAEDGDSHGHKVSRRRAVVLSHRAIG